MSGRNRRSQTVWVLALLAIAAFGSFACGYLKAGEWRDEPKNWNRAFASSQPPDVVVLHSLYWRSPHWSYEFQYFFALAPNEALKKQLFERNALVRLTSAEADAAAGQFFGAKPAWFAPKHAAEYEVWVYGSEPRGNFKVLIDKADGTIFLHDFQI